MDDRLIIEELLFQGYCGIGAAERMRPQPMAVDLHLTVDTRPAAATDDLKRAVDYAEVTAQVLALVHQEQFHLLETLAERLAQSILAQYPVQAVELWVRKLKPPMGQAPKSVGIRIRRQRSV